LEEHAFFNSNEKEEELYYFKILLQNKLLRVVIELRVDEWVRLIEDGNEMS